MRKLVQVMSCLVGLVGRQPMRRRALIFYVAATPQARYYAAKSNASLLRGLPVDVAAIEFLNSVPSGIRGAAGDDFVVFSICGGRHLAE